MNQTFNLLFYVKKAKTNSQGEAPIYLRITIDGKPAEISTKRSISPSKWNSIAQKVNGNTDEIKSLNYYLKTFEQKVYDAYHLLMKDEEVVSTEILKNRLLGKEEKQQMLIPIFEEHNKKMEQLVGKEYAKGTLGCQDMEQLKAVLSKKEKLRQLI